MARSASFVSSAPAFSYTLFDAGNIRLRTDVEGGGLMDVGCYCVSGSRLLAGEPESVFGRAYVGPTGTDWVFTGSLRFPGDVLGVFDCGTAMTNRDELEAMGTEGSLFLDDPWHCNRPVIELRRDGGVERIEAERGNPYRLELENLGAAIRGQGAPLLGREDAVAQARVIEALFSSAAGGWRSRSREERFARRRFRDPITERRPYLLELMRAGRFHRRAAVTPTETGATDDPKTARSRCRTDRDRPRRRRLRR